MPGPIEDDPDNAEAVDRLLASCGPAGCTPFVGAGLSVPWKLLDWWSFLQTEASRLGISETVDAALRANDYEVAAELIDHRLTSCGQRQGITASVRHTYGKDVDGSAHLDGPIHALPALARGVVITTNFDRVLESVFSFHGRPLFPIWGARARTVMDSISADSPVLLKLHGDALHAEERVLTRQEYARHYGSKVASRFTFDEPLPVLLQVLFSSKPVLFVGCSLNSDRTMDVLSKVAASTRTACFAVMARQREHDRQAELQARLERFGVAPLWFPPGAFDRIRPFLEFVARRLPEPAPPSIGLGRPAPPSKDLADERDVAWNSLRTVNADVLAVAEAMREVTTFDDVWDLYVDNKDDIRRAAIDVALPIYRYVQTRARAQHPGKQLTIQIAVHSKLRLHDRRREAAKLIRAAQSLCDTLPVSVVTIDFHHAMANDYLSRKEYDRANEHSRLSLKQARDVGLVPDFAHRRMWHLRARIMFALNRVRAARFYYAASLCDARRKHDRDDQACYLGELAGIYFDADQPRRAARLARIGLSISSPVDFQNRELLFGNLGNSLHELKDFAASGDAQRQAWWYAFQGRGYDAATLIYIANVAWEEYELFAEGSNQAIGDGLIDPHLAWSLDLFDQALRIAEANKAVIERSHILVERSLPLAQLGQFREALLDIQRAIPILKRNSDRFLGTAYNNRGVIWQWKGQPKLAGRWFDLAARVSQTDPDARLRATVAHNISTPGTRYYKGGQRSE